MRSCPSRPNTTSASGAWSSVFRLRGWRHKSKRHRIVCTMARKLFSRRVLDVLNRASEIKADIDFCDEGGGLQEEMHHFTEWLGDHLRTDFERDNWEEPDIETDGEGVCLYLYSSEWQRPMKTTWRFRSSGPTCSLTSRACNSTSLLRRSLRAGMRCSRPCGQS